MPKNPAPVQTGRCGGRQAYTRDEPGCERSAPARFAATDGADREGEFVVPPGLFDPGPGLPEHGLDGRGQCAVAAIPLIGALDGLPARAPGQAAGPVNC